MPTIASSARIVRRPRSTAQPTFDGIDVPATVTDLDSFRAWVTSDEVPEKQKIWWLRGKVWIDMSKEQIFSHLLLKVEIFAVLSALVKSEKLGLFLPDGLLLSNEEANLSGNPDATFASFASLQSGLARLVEGKSGGYVEMQGSPDLVIEIVSDSSIQKDTVVLREDYWKAGIKEYWLIDARKQPVKFDILRRGAKAFVTTRKQDGWLRSAVFGRSFRLIQSTNALEQIEHTLETR